MMNDEQLKALRQQAPAWTEEPATGPQLNYIKGLVEDRVIPEAWLERIRQRTQEGLDKGIEVGLTKGVAGQIIAALKGLPKKDTSTFQGEARDRAKNDPHIRDLPAGRYAVRRNPGEDDEDIAFYHVKEVKSAGGSTSNPYKIILTVAGPNEHLITGPFAKIAVKQIVRAGIGDSAVLYGRKIGKCFKCHTQITNRISRALGTGPVCGGRVYSDWEERVNRVRARFRELGLDPNENVAADHDPWEGNEGV